MLITNVIIMLYYYAQFQDSDVSVITKAAAV